MKLKFKKQAYQTRAVDSVVDCFKGQLNTSGVSYRIDPGASQKNKDKQMDMFVESGLKNSDMTINESQILENIKLIQRNQNLPQSEVLVKIKSLRSTLILKWKQAREKLIVILRQFLRCIKNMAGISLLSLFPV